MHKSIAGDLMDFLFIMKCPRWLRFQLFTYAFLIHFLFSTCIADCDDPPSILNADIDLKNRKDFPNGTTVKYTCHNGYVLTPNISATAICISKNETSFWKLETFVCKSACTGLPSIPHGELLLESITLPILSGTSIRYECHDGYQSDGTTNQIICQNGSWVLPQEACRAKSCGYPSDVENSKRKGNIFSFPNSITYVCDEGFQLKGTATLYCMPSGIWRPNDYPVCDAVVCPLLSPLENGKVISSDRGYNSVATYECNRRYHLEGNAQRVCQADATWNGTVPTCVATTCLDPGPLENGRVLPAKKVYNAGDVVVFQCYETRPGEGPHASKCLEDGTWQKRPPLCPAQITTPVKTSSVSEVTPRTTTETTFIPKALSCDDPGDIRNGKRQITGFTSNSNVTYSCEEGYELRGQGTLTCLTNGKWNLNKLPICVKPIPIPMILGVVIGIIAVIALGVGGFFLYRWREKKLRGFGKKSKALTADATDMEEIAGLDKGKKPIPVTVL